MKRRTRWFGLLLLTCALAVLSACDGFPSKISSGTTERDNRTELTVWLYPGTGMEPFLSIYEKAHPDIKINLHSMQYEVVHNNLQTAFAAGYGAPDVCLVEVSFVERLKQFPSYFYNLKDFGADAAESNFLPWKWKQATNLNGSFVFGLPTDIGPIAMAYRPALFRQAGLPADRDELSRTLTTWDDFIEAGARVSRVTGKKMIDNLQSMYRIILGQADKQYFDPQGGGLILETNPAVKRAWNYAVKAAELDLSAHVSTYNPSWGEGLNNGDFAVVFAPAWLLDTMKKNAPQSQGLWDIADLPEGGGNWGGSFLTLPKEGKHPKEAYELIRWLTGPETQLSIFKENNNFPSSKVLYKDPAIQNKTDSYFSGAPVGSILSRMAEKVVPVYEGPKQFIIISAIEAALVKIDNRELPPGQAWDEAIRLIHKSLDTPGAAFELSKPG